MNEFELIRQLCANLPVNDSVVIGAGDDCAALDLGLSDTLLLLKTDAVVEGIHYHSDADPARIGRKAINRCLSDIAAMGGVPTAAVITLGLPAKFEFPYVQALYAGLNQAAQDAGVAIVGGETTTNPDRVLISVALIGTLPKTVAAKRTGAQPGDAIFVTGELGGSQAGKHLDFIPRLTEGRWLVQNFDIHAMKDLSDGLAGDLPRLLERTGAGAELLAHAIPISRAARLRAATGSPQPAAANGPTHPPTRPQATRVPGGALGAALADGEDFELLIVLPAKQAVPLLDAWKKEFPALPLTCIGKVRPEPGVTLRDKEGARPLPAHGYVHFE
jgi:thiamine-monophosphate kinase